MHVVLPTNIKKKTLTYYTQYNVYNFHRLYYNTMTVIIRLKPQTREISQRPLLTMDQAMAQMLTTLKLVTQTVSRMRIRNENRMHAVSDCISYFNVF